MDMSYSIYFNKRYYRPTKGVNVDKLPSSTWVLYYDPTGRVRDGQLKDREDDWNIINVELKKGN